MADVIHEIHEGDSSSNALMVVVLIIVIAVAGFLLWRYLPAKQSETNQPGVNVTVTLPNGSSTSY